MLAPIIAPAAAVATTSARSTEQRPTPRPTSQATQTQLRLSPATLSPPLLSPLPAGAQHLGNLRLEIPIFKLLAEHAHAPVRLVSAEEPEQYDPIEDVHYLLYTADDTVPSPLPAELLPYMRTANVVHLEESNLESEIETSSMRAHELYGYSTADWARKRRTERVQSRACPKQSACRAERVQNKQRVLQHIICLRLPSSYPPMRLLSTCVLCVCAVCVVPEQASRRASSVASTLERLSSFHAAIRRAVSSARGKRRAAPCARQTSPLCEG